MKSYGSTKDRVEFSVNGTPCSVGSEISSDVMLVDYLRKTLKLSGTKYMCRGGACGVCCVSVRKYPGGPLMVINSCMAPITSCKDWEITTIEGHGNRKDGYHIMQKTLAENNGTQCGYCSPSNVHNMICMCQSDKELTMLEIEKSFAGNLCRCTGYRPIADTAKKFAIDCPAEERITDIEDLRICKKTGLSCNKNKCDNEDDWCVVSNNDLKGSEIIEIKMADDKYWYTVGDLDSVFNILNDKGYDSCRLVHGNTATGVYPITNKDAKYIIDISNLAELKNVVLDQNLIVGVGITVTEFLNLCIASASDNFNYFLKFEEHINLVASIPLKNLGSLGGNLMIKHQHNAFASDLFLLLETVGAYLEICTAKGIRIKLSMQDFLKEDMKGKIIVNIILPPYNDQYKIETFKIMARSQNAHAYVNAGFLYKLTNDNIVLEARIAHGGLSPEYCRAYATEKFLIGKKLFDNSTLQSALNIMENELVVVEEPPNPSVKCRKQLALSLFYKGLISLCPKEILNSRYLSAASKIDNDRPVSSGKQIYDTDASLWPLNKLVPKVEALIQCAGEIKYTDDLPTQPGEVYAAFVLSPIAVGEIVKIDASKALSHPKVIAFYTADDIKGENSFTPGGTPFYLGNEKILADGKINYHSQPYGIIVAETQAIAYEAASMVTATYTNVKKPVLDIQDAIKEPNRVSLFTSVSATDKGTDVVKTIKGQNNIYGQLHVPMELMSCVTMPTEQGLEVHVTSQWMDACQVMISKALKIDANCVDVYVHRLGGSFGQKISRSVQTAVACSLVAHTLNRPCRLVVPFDTCARAVGKRGACQTNFECDVNGSGVIQSIVYKQYEDNGYMIDESLSALASDVYHNCYTSTKWDYYLYDVLTDSAKTTWCRAPGTLESIAMAEHVMERISYELSLDPVAVRIANVDESKYPEMLAIIEELKEKSSYCERKVAVADFNTKNRWKKRGLRTSFVRWAPTGYSILEISLSVCHSDGSVIITHGGIEMGQGINTKAVQICAYLLNISMDKIKVKGNNTIIAPNCFMTGGSLGSQNVGLGVGRICDMLCERLKPIRDKMDDPTWEDLIIKAYENNVNLRVDEYVGAADTYPMSIPGAGLCEVEIDVLTGQLQVIQVDIMQEMGKSVSPGIDIGQVEGAFIMGQGYWTCESLVYDKESGKLLTDKLFNYFAPLMRDIPQKFNVTLKTLSESSKSIFGAKCIGEPPMCLPVVVAFAIREAIVACRSESGIPSNVWFDIDGPLTLEQILLNCSVKTEDFKFN